jgi:hypothetical protein
MTKEVLLVGAGLAVGVWIGVQLAKGQVRAGVDDGADRMIRLVGGDPAGGYGKVAHTLIDQFAGSVLNGHG